MGTGLMVQALAGLLGSALCYLSAGVVGCWIDGLSPGRTVGLCVQVWWGYRTDGLNPGRLLGNVYR